MHYSTSSRVYIRFNSVQNTPASMGCLFPDAPLGAQEVTGDSWGGKRM